jgi:hypothetical protein
MLRSRRRRQCANLPASLKLHMHRNLGDRTSMAEHCSVCRREGRETQLDKPSVVVRVPELV